MAADGRQFLIKDGKGSVDLELRFMRQRLNVVTQERDELRARVQHLEGTTRV